METLEPDFYKENEKWWTEIKKISFDEAVNRFLKVGYDMRTAKEAVGFVQGTFRGDIILLDEDGNEIIETDDEDDEI